MATLKKRYLTKYNLQCLQERVKEITVIYCVLISKLNRHIVIHCNIIKIYDACSSSSLINNIDETTDKFLIWRKTIITHIQILGDRST